MPVDKKEEITGSILVRGIGVGILIRQKHVKHSFVLVFMWKLLQYHCPHLVVYIDLSDFKKKKAKRHVDLIYCSRKKIVLDWRYVGTISGFCY